MSGDVIAKARQMGRATHIDPLEGVAVDGQGRTVEPDRVASTHALIIANIHKLAGGDPGSMSRKNYLRQGSSFNALGAALRGK